MNTGAEWIRCGWVSFACEYTRKRSRMPRLSLLFIDDYGHADDDYADIVLNQNIYADMSFYKKPEPVHTVSAWDKICSVKKRIPRIFRCTGISG